MSNIKSRIAARIEQRKLAKLKKAAQNRVAAAWTIAKTMLPSAPSNIQEKFASSLLENSEEVLTSALKQTAINAHYTKVAETFESVHKCELNDLLEKPNVLEAMKKELEKEMKGKPVKANKIAEEGDEAPKAEDMPEAPEGEQHEEGAEGEMSEGDMGDAGTAPAAEPMPGDMGHDESGVEPVSETLSDAQKLELHHDIEKAEDDIDELEQEVMEGDSFDLDIAAAFSDEVKSAKKKSLANEEDSREPQYDVDISWDDDVEGIADPEMDHEEQEHDGFFGPSGVETYKASLDLDGMDSVDIHDAADFFSKDASKEVDQLGRLMSRNASEEIVNFGEGADHFESVDQPEVDAETDHEDSILGEILGKESQEEYKDGLDRKDNVPVLEKAASKKPGRPAVKAPQEKKAGKPVKSLGDVASKGNPKKASSSDYYGSKQQNEIAALLFGDIE